MWSIDNGKNTPSQKEKYYQYENNKIYVNEIKTAFVKNYELRYIKRNVKNA